MTLPGRARRTIVVVMGVSGSGKTTVGQLLADRLGVGYAEADAFHPPENIAKMDRVAQFHKDKAGDLPEVAEVLAAQRARLVALQQAKGDYVSPLEL